MVRLGSWLPFGRVAEFVAHFTHVRLGEATVRRLTETAGGAYEAIQTAEVARIAAELPDPPEAGPPVQQVSVDGAMVPLQGGQWVEVKTVVVGTVEHASPGGEPQAIALSTFSRHAEASEFARLATGELHRRGTATAGTVVGVADGAPWCQGFYDLHCPEAVRILDFYHAQSYLVAAAQATFGPGTAATAEWLGRQAHALRHAAVAPVLAALTELPVADAPSRGVAEAARDTALGYLEPRQELMRYPAFRAAGYPIGSGAVESANRWVVEARLAHAGMHWAEAHLNPMLALRGIACSDRWAEAWPAVTDERRRQARAAVAARRAARAVEPAPVPTPLPPAPPPAPPPPPIPEAVLAVRDELKARPKRVVNGKPTDDHPWRAPALGPRHAPGQPPSPSLPKL